MPPVLTKRIKTLREPGQTKVKPRANPSSNLNLPEASHTPEDKITPEVNPEAVEVIKAITPENKKEEDQELEMTDLNPETELKARPRTVTDVESLTTNNRTVTSRTGPA